MNFILKENIRIMFCLKILKKYWLVILIIEIRNVRTADYDDYNLPKITPPCQSKKYDNRDCTDCSNYRSEQVHVQGIENHLKPAPTSLKCLVISFIAYTNITSTLKRFKELTHLYALKTGFPFLLPPEFFNCEKLEYINLTGSNHPEDEHYVWPKTTKILDLTNFKLSSLNIKNLTNLLVLNITKNDFVNIPILSPKAPFEMVVFDDNPWHSFELDEFAKYCQIKNLSISFKKNSDFMKPFKSCQCKLFQKWIEVYEIQLVKNFTCAEPPSPCNLTFSAASLENREKCMADIRPPFRLFLFIAFGLALLLLGIIVFFAYKYAWLHKKEELGEVEIIDGPKTTVEASTDSENVEESSLQEEAESDSQSES